MSDQLSERFPIGSEWWAIRSSSDPGSSFSEPWRGKVQGPCMGGVLIWLSRVDPRPGDPESDAGIPMRPNDLYSDEESAECEYLAESLYDLVERQSHDGLRDLIKRTQDILRAVQARAERRERERETPRADPR